MRTNQKRLAIVLAVAMATIPAAALATHVFNDVEDASTHDAGITFMKTSGVSVGCDANDNFCPDDFVTRAQMATFMYRLSGNDPATTPSVNAALVGDSPLAEIAPATFDGGNGLEVVAVSAAEFQSDGIDGAYSFSLIDGSVRPLTTSPDGICFHASVRLPQGAEINGIEVYLVDEDSDVDFSVQMWEKDLSSTGLDGRDFVASAFSEGASPAVQVATGAPTLFDGLVDNRTHTYFLTTCLQNSDHELHAVHIKYLR